MVAAQPATVTWSTGPPGISAERRDHFRREPLELLLVVDQRVEQDQLRAGIRDRAQAGDDVLGRAGEDVLRPAAAAVVLLERVLEPPAAARRVVLDVDVHALADAERGGIAVLLDELLPDDPNLLGERGRRLGAGAHDPVAVPDRAAHPGRRAAAEPDGRVRLLHRLGLHRA